MVCVEALRQPPNILRQLTSAKYETKAAVKINGIFKCKDSRCKICTKYLIECATFKVDNGVIWHVPSHITCHSKLVCYYQICLGCNKCSNVGKTNNLRLRTNVHISSCKSGVTTDKFDSHVFICKKDHAEPLFKLYILLELNDYNKLLVYEDYFHKQGFDTLNKHKASIK